MADVALRRRWPQSRRVAHSLGMYPGDACYDPTRPSWLPYVIDSATEGLCWWGNEAAKADVHAAQQAAAAAAQATGQADAGVSDAEALRQAAIRSAVAAKNAKCNGFQSYSDESARCEFDPSRPVFLFLVGSVVVGLVTVAVLKR